MSTSSCELRNQAWLITRLEHAVNNDGARETSAAYENELVGMLNRPNKPAVIGIEFFQLSNLYGEGGVNAVSAFIGPLTVLSPRPEFIATTTRHISASKAHYCLS